MYTKKQIIISNLLIAIPIVISAFVWNRLPENMAIHFDFSNKPNGYASRIVSLFGIPLICLFVQWTTILTAKYSNAQESIPKVFAYICFWLPPIICNICEYIIISYNIN